MSRATWGWAHGALLLVVAAGALAVAIAADGARAPRRVLARLSSPALLVLGLLAAVVVAKAAFAAGRVGVAGPGRYLVVHLLAVVGVAVVASRRDLHLPVLAGYLVGVTTSAVVSLAQALDLLEPHWPAADRFPGWAATTPQLSWQLALAVVIGVHLVRSTAGAARSASIGAVCLCLAALATCGSQGGLLGIAVAVGVLLVHNARRHVIARGEVLRLGGVLLGLAVVALLALALLGVSPQSVVGLTGDTEKGYENEVARIDGLASGVRALRDEPLTGPGVDRYTADGHVLPHVVPVTLGISTGLVGVGLGLALMAVMAVLVVRGPREGAPLGWVAAAILSIYLAKCLVTTNGPLSDLADQIVLVIAAAAWSGPTCRGRTAGATGETRPSPTDRSFV